MAKINLILAALLVFLLLFFYRFTFTDGRLLNREASSVGNVKGTTTAAAAYRYDDFQPTTPGHSPGAGHATGPSGNNNN